MSHKNAARMAAPPVSTVITSSLDPVAPTPCRRVPPGTATAHRADTGAGSVPRAPSPPPLVTAPPLQSALTSMLPLFHFRRQDTVITAMQHNVHFHLLALLTSDNEIYMCGTQQMPAIEFMASGERIGAEGFNLHRPSRLQTAAWDPARHTICIDALPHPVSQLCWAPWQNGIYLAALCPGRGIYFYRYSHSRWTREDLLEGGSFTQISFAPVGYAIAVACGRSGVQIFSRHEGVDSDGDIGAKWKENTRQPASQKQESSEEEEDDGEGTAATPHASFHCVCVAWDLTGMFLSAGLRDGSVRIFCVSRQDSCVSLMPCSVMKPPGRGVACQQLCWAPLAGRSFLLLLTVFNHGVVVSMFRRPPGLSESPLENTGRRLHCPLTLSHIVSVPLRCREVLHAVWNTSGTRFVTSQRDSSVNAWRVEIAHTQRRSQSLCQPRAAFPSPSSQQCSPPVVSIRHVSSVYPYSYAGGVDS